MTAVTQCLVAAACLASIGLAQAQAPDARKTSAVSPRVRKLVAAIVDGAPAARYDALWDLLLGENTRMAREAAVVAAVAHTLTDPDGAVRSMAAQLLTLAGDAARPHLVKAARDERLRSMIEQILIDQGVPDPDRVLGDRVDSRRLDKDWSLAGAHYAEPFAVTRDATLFVSGDHLTAYGRSGSRLWQADDVPKSRVRALTTDRDGSVLVTGRDGDHWITEKYARQGKRIWTAQYRPSVSVSSLDQPHGIAAAEDGIVHVVGIVTDTQQHSQLVLLSYDTNGREQNAVVCSAPVVVEPGGNRRHLTLSDLDAVGLDGAGNAYAVFADLLLGSKLAKCASAGRLEWSVDVEDGFTPAAIAVDPLGTIYVTGGSRHQMKAPKLLRLRRDGTLDWSLDLATELAADTVMAVNQAGAVYLALSTFGDHLIIKVNAQGNVVWRHREEASSRGIVIPTGIAVTDDDNIYVSTWFQAAWLHKTPEGRLQPVVSAGELRKYHVR